MFDILKFMLQILRAFIFKLIIWKKNMKTENQIQKHGDVVNCQG